MKKLISKAKSTLQDFDSQLQFSSSSGPKSVVTQTSQPFTITPPKPIDVLRYRYHHGANLGSIFVLEQWLFGSMFPPGSPGGSELDAVTTSVRTIGLHDTREKWENHWRNAVTDVDFEWLVREAKCTSLRVPIGYFTLGGNFSKGTPFENVKDVYVNAWAAVRDLIARARSWGIGILLDLHAVPGGANTDEHSGSTSGKAELWGKKKNLDLAKKALVFVAQEIQQGIDGVVGIQVCNEAIWDARGMYEWYEDVIGAIGAVDQSIPVYISDGWDLNRALNWCNGRKVFGNSVKNPVVVDTHRYFTFDEKDRNQAPGEIIARVPGELGELQGKEGNICDKGEAQVIVGEWSCVLDGRTWGRVRPEEKDGLVKEFGQTQTQKWQDKAGGHYFWTYKMEWMDGGEWGFAEQTKKNNISPPKYLKLSSEDIKTRAHSSQARRQELGSSARGAHEGYWNQTSPGVTFQHELYSEGWEIGFSDAYSFFTMRSENGLGNKATEGGDKIGCLEIWVKKRLLESGHRGGFVWEWEQGFRRGVSDLYQCVGI